MNTITEAIANGKILVSDGAWGTLLQESGLEPGACPELWCTDHRDAVLRIASNYIKAGSHIIGTNSFGANRYKLEHFGLADRVTEINEAAAAISREAAGPDRHVMGSVGPTGKMLVMGDITESELDAAFTEQIIALEKGGADACCIETMTALDEATIAVKTAKKNTNLEVLATFTFERTVQGEYRTMMGVAPAEMAQALVEAGANVIGANCGNGMEQMVEIVEELRAAVPCTSILVQANAGMPVNIDGKTTFPESPEEMAKNARAVITAGANIIGGCCGSTPAHIKAIVESIEQ